MPHVGVWVKAKSGQVPDFAVPGGHTRNSETIFIARAEDDGAICPGKLIPSLDKCFITHNGKEHSDKHYEVYINSINIHHNCTYIGNDSPLADLLLFRQVLLHPQHYHWLANHGGQIPHNAVEGGRSRHGETLFIGRCHIQGTITCGKLQPSHGHLQISLDGVVHEIKEYEVLCANVQH